MNTTLECSEKFDINYLARIVELDESNFSPHPNASKLKVAEVFGFKVIVGIEAKPGKYVYFPIGSQISDSFLSYHNLYREKKKNTDKTISGCFDNSGKVKIIKLREQVSEGYLVTWDDFEIWIHYVTDPDSHIDDFNKKFDTLSYGTSKIWVCKKYLDKSEESKRPKNRGKVPERLLGRISREQFRFHYETELLKFCPGVIKPETYIWITKKVDGTSGISSKVMVSRLGWEIWKPKMYYANIYASSSVIKSKKFNKMAGPGFYGVDVWEKANDVVAPKLQSGMTAYYEIVGYLPSGGTQEFIQKDCDFGCIKPVGNEYKERINFRVLVYRLTITTPEGFVYELNPKQVKDWCDKVGLESVKILYEGFAKDLYPELDPKCHWSENFIDKLEKDSERLGMETYDTECKNPVPQEGIVIRVGEKAYKLKTNLHLLRKQEWEEKGYCDPEDIS